MCDKVSLSDSHGINIIYYKDSEIYFLYPNGEMVNTQDLKFCEQ